jgi:hypothetical protein
LSTAARAADLEPPQPAAARISGPGRWYFYKRRLFPNFAPELAAMDQTGRLPVKDFIILTDFSRCQGRMIGRVSRRPEQPFCPKPPHGFEYKDFP